MPSGLSGAAENGVCRSILRLWYGPLGALCGGRMRAVQGDRRPVRGGTPDRGVDERLVEMVAGTAI